MQRRPDRAGELELFVATVNAGSLAGGARALGIVPSAASRTLARLENRLGVQLLRRSTRQITMTEEGRRFFLRARAILAELEAAEREAAFSAAPSGRVRISSSASYVAHILGGILPAFAAKYPAIGIDIIQQDTIVDLVSEPIDVAIRAGPLPGSSLIARPLGTTRIVAVAAPVWLKLHGTPTGNERFIDFTYGRGDAAWATADAPPERCFRISDGEGLRQLALAGLGPIRAAEFTVRNDIRDGRLVRLSDANADAMEAFNVVFMGPSRAVPMRVRTLLDYLGEYGRVS